MAERPRKPTSDEGSTTNGTDDETRDETRDSQDGESSDRKETGYPTNQDDEPWIYSNGVYHFYLHSMGWLLEHLFDGLMTNKGIPYDEAVQYVYDNALFSTGKINGREVFVIPNDEGFENIIIAGVQSLNRFSGPIA